MSRNRQFFEVKPTAKSKMRQRSRMRFLHGAKLPWRGAPGLTHTSKVQGWLIKAHLLQYVARLASKAQSMPGFKSPILNLGPTSAGYALVSSTESRV